MAFSAVHVPKRLQRAAIIGAAGVTLFFAGQGLLAFTTHEVVVSVMGDGNTITAKEGFYDVAALCNDKASVVTYGVTTEIRDKEYVIQNGLEQVRFKATPGNFVAQRYWIENGIQQSAPVEITKSALNCMLGKVH